MLGSIQFLPYTLITIQALLNHSQDSHLLSTVEMCHGFVEQFSVNIILRELQYKMNTKNDNCFSSRAMQQSLLSIRLFGILINISFTIYNLQSFITGRDSSFPTTLQIESNNLISQMKEKRCRTYCRLYICSKVHIHILQISIRKVYCREA